jgi:hypothetical protein
MLTRLESFVFVATLLVAGAVAAMIVTGQARPADGGGNVVCTCD